MADEFLKGFPLTGNEVAVMKDREFEILGSRYDIVPSLDNPAESVEKLVLTIQLNGMAMDYMPNKTSIITMMQRWGRNTTKWIGHKGKLLTKQMQVGKFMKDVIFVE